MKKFHSKTLKLPFVGSSILLLSFLIFNSGCQKIKDVIDGGNDNTPHVPGSFKVVNLVANNNQYGAARVDPNLINGWGIAFSG
ncbi:MAG TPA: hypothetical protein VM888_06995, partial [Chitinophagaceae bacterium]|nr:hypothetical protein [Chitinophagaceae bacterium]